MAMRRRGRWPAVLAVAAIFTSPAIPAAADCGLLPFSAVQPIVESFLFGRKSLLGDYPNGGLDLVRTVSIIAMSSKAALPKLLSVARTANQAQKKSIAEGLGIAASRCLRTASAESRNMELSVAALRDPVLTRNFATKFRSNTELTLESEDDLRRQTLQQLYQARTAPPSKTLPLPQEWITPLAPIEPVGPVRSLVR